MVFHLFTCFAIYFGIFCISFLFIFYGILLRTNAAPLREGTRLVTSLARRRAGRGAIDAVARIHRDELCEGKERKIISVRALEREGESAAYLALPHLCRSCAGCVDCAMAVPHVPASAPPPPPTWTAAVPDYAAAAVAAAGVGAATWPARRYRRDCDPGRAARSRWTNASLGAGAAVRD